MNAMNTTIASSEVTADRSSRPGRSALWRNWLIGPATDSRASITPSAIRPPSMTRRRGRNLPYELSSRMPITMPPPSGSTMTAKSFGRSPSAVCAKSGPEDAEHADQRRGDPEVQQRPADRPVAPDEVEALAQLAPMVDLTAAFGSRRPRRRRSWSAPAAATTGA